EPTVALDGGEMDSMLRFVAAGIGVAILPAVVVTEIVSPDSPVVVRRLLPRLTRSLVVARRRDRYFSTAAREFTSVLESAARPIPTSPPALAVTRGSRVAGTPASPLAGNQGAALAVDPGTLVARKLGAALAVDRDSPLAGNP